MNPCIDILLVEDDPGDVRLALAVFQKLQLAERCVVVNDGEEAIDYLCSSGRFSLRTPGLPRLVLLDLKMPRMNGFDLLERIKTDAALKLIPVVALTSSREERDVDRAYDLGVNGYVVKGIDFKDYQATLRALAMYWSDINERPGFLERRRVAAIRSAAKVERRRVVAAILNPWLWPVCRC